MTSESIESDIVITRVFNAPRALVWKAWSDPVLVMRWWGPQYFTSPTCKIDFRVGGHYLFCMRSPDGQDFWSTGVYREIVPLERIVYTDSLADAQGNVVPPSYYGIGTDFPQEVLVTVTFEEIEAGKTKLTLRQSGFRPGPMRENAIAGWSTSLDKLAGSLTV